MCRRNMSASIQNSSSSPVARATPRGARRRRTHGARSRVGVKAVKSCVPAQRRGALRERLAVDLPAATRRRARARTRCACAARARGSSRCGCARRGARRSRPARARCEHRDVVGEQRRSGAADRPPRARSSRPGPRRARRGRCARRPSAQRRAVAAAHRAPSRSARSSSSCTVRSPRLARPAGEVGAVVLDRELRDHQPAALSCAASGDARACEAPSARCAQTSSMKTISVASLRRGPSFRMRV